MPYDIAAVERVRHTLTACSDVVEKRMISGMCFMVGGAMCCGVIGDALMARVGAEARVGACAALYAPDDVRRPHTGGVCLRSARRLPDRGRARRVGPASPRCRGDAPSSTVAHCGQS